MILFRGSGADRVPFWRLCCPGGGSEVAIRPLFAGSSGAILRHSLVALRQGNQTVPKQLSATSIPSVHVLRRAFYTCLPWARAPGALGASTCTSGPEETDGRACRGACARIVLCMRCEVSTFAGRRCVSVLYLTGSECARQGMSRASWP